jgi:hypothetical protein
LTSDDEVFDAHREPGIENVSMAARLLQDKIKGVQIPLKVPPQVSIRTAVVGDSAACGQICYDAFATLNAAHGFPGDFPAAAVPTGLLAMMFSSPAFYCVVAESHGRILGSNVLTDPVDGQDRRIR